MINIKEPFIPPIFKLINFFSIPDNPIEVTHWYDKDGHFTTKEKEVITKSKSLVPKARLATSDLDFEIIYNNLKEKNIDIRELIIAKNLKKTFLNIIKKIPNEESGLNLRDEQRIEDFTKWIDEKIQSLQEIKVIHGENSKLSSQETPTTSSENVKLSSQEILATYSENTKPGLQEIVTTYSENAKLSSPETPVTYNENTKPISQEISITHSKNLNNKKAQVNKNNYS